MTREEEQQRDDDAFASLERKVADRDAEIDRLKRLLDSATSLVRNGNASTSAADRAAEITRGWTALEIDCKVAYPGRENMPDRVTIGGSVQMDQVRALIARHIDEAVSCSTDPARDSAESSDAARR